MKSQSKEKEKFVGKSTDIRKRDSESDEFEEDYEDQDEVAHSDEDSVRAKGKTADFTDRNDKNLKDKIEIVDRFFGFETNKEDKSVLDSKDDHVDKGFVQGLKDMDRDRDRDRRGKDQDRNEELEEMDEEGSDKDLSENRTEEIEKLKSFEEFEEDLENVDIPEDNQSNLGDENEDVGSAGVDSDQQDD